MPNQVPDSIMPDPIGNAAAPEMLGEPFWSANPVENGATTVLSVPIEYANGTVVAGEYYGNVDPGQGNGTPMEVMGDHLEATMTMNRPSGPHPVNIRAKDDRGQWSVPAATVLTIMSTPVITPDSGMPA